MQRPTAESEDTQLPSAFEGSTWTHYAGDTSEPPPDISSESLRLPPIRSMLPPTVDGHYWSASAFCSTAPVSSIPQSLESNVPRSTQGTPGTSHADLAMALPDGSFVPVVVNLEGKDLRKLREKNREAATRFRLRKLEAKRIAAMEAADNHTSSLATSPTTDTLNVEEVKLPIPAVSHECRGSIEPERVTRPSVAPEGDTLSGSTPSNLREIAPASPAEDKEDPAPDRSWSTQDQIGGRRLLEEPDTGSRSLCGL